jgi:hypothetical protein
MFGMHSLGYKLFYNWIFYLGIFFMVAFQQGNPLLKVGFLKKNHHLTFGY